MDGPLHQIIYKSTAADYFVQGTDFGRLLVVYTGYQYGANGIF